MARLASQAKLGYYPTPPEVIQHIRTKLTVESGCRFLDPCCGDGTALKSLTEGFEAKTFGIELEKGRVQAAAHTLNHVIRADAIAEAQVSAGMCDVLFLNPPYDEGEDGRMEYDFLAKYYRTLCQKGILIFVIPLICLRKQNIADLLCNFSELQICRFPEGLFETFSQIVVIGRKRTISTAIGENRLRLRDFSFSNIFEAETTRDIKPVAVKHSANPKFTFTAVHADPDELLPLTESLKAQFFRKTAPPDLAEVRPLVPLRKGHLAMLLAAGYVNGELKQGKEHLVIKGTVTRSETSRDESTETHDVTVTKTKSVITVRVLNMNTGEIEDVK